MTDDAIFSIVDRLGQAKIAYSLQVTRQDAITIQAAVPGQRWEIDMHKNGEINVEVFKSTGELYEHERLVELIEQFTV